MLDAIAALLGISIIFGPILAFAFCKRTEEHANDSPDVVGGLLAGANIILIGLTVTLYLALNQVFPSWFAGSIQGIAIAAIQYFLWRRALRNTHCGERFSEALTKLRGKWA